MNVKNRVLTVAAAAAFALVPSLVKLAPAAPPRVIEITADKDNKFKVAGKKDPSITLKVNEVATLKITSHRGEEWDKADNAEHSFTINALKGGGSWDFRLKEGVNTFTVVAPDTPGEYKAECTVKCGKGHDDMAMKVIVTP